MQRGMGQQGEFDCSGFAAWAIAQVLGGSVGNWLSSLRHTRQMWHELLRDPLPYSTRQEALGQRIGQLLVMGYHWDFPDGTRELTPSHVGILTGVSEQQLPIVLHAKPKVGRVIEGPITYLGGILGTVDSEALGSLALGDLSDVRS